MRLVPLVLALAACGTDPQPQGVFTQSICPPVDPPDYTNFGAPFFAAYCTRCHSEALAGADRQGAPVTIDFDTESLVRENTSRIDKQAAFGPAAHNMLMPIDAPFPSDAERTRLGELVACEVAR